MDGWPAPSWSPTADEKAVLDRSIFHHCEITLNAYAERINGKISNETYTLSKEWGKILRAKVAWNLRGRSATSLVTCWSASEPGVEIFIKIDDGKE